MLGYIVCFKNKRFRSKWHVVKDKESILLGIVNKRNEFVTKRKC